MPTGQLEHANLTVSDPQRSAELLKQLCCWRERWSGPSKLGGQTIHVGQPGDGGGYVALYTNADVRAEGGRNYSKGQPLNHLGLLVDDLRAAEDVVRAAGLEPFGHDDYDPGARFYFFDWDGIEFEVVSYAGDVK